MVEPFSWNDEERALELLDQTLLPEEERWLTLRTPDEVAEAIEELRVRGAPAIGIAAAYGLVLAAGGVNSDPPAKRRAVGEARDRLAETRPTAVNLFAALDRMTNAADEAVDRSPEGFDAVLLEEAHAIRREDREACRAIGEHALELLRPQMGVLTHCHTGGLATSGYGTAMAPLILSSEQGRPLRVFVDETRPLLQGSRITAWELEREGVPATVITDSTAAHVMAQGRIDAVIVGADRVAANGDVANKIGTYGLAVLAAAHEIPFYVAAPTSTIDLDTATGSDIPIEERAAEEITHGFGRQTAPDEAEVYAPAFDVTPARFVSALITERGILQAPYESTIRDALIG